MTTPHTTPELPALTMREAFVKWAGDNGFTVDHFRGEYTSSDTQAAWEAWQGAKEDEEQTAKAAPEGVSLRESADRLAQAGHDFWTACRKDAGGGAVRWLDLSDGTLIIFTRLEYKQQLLAVVDEITGVPVVYFEEDGGDEGVSAIAVEKAAPASPQPLAPPPGYAVVPLTEDDWLPMETAPRDGTRVILEWGPLARVGYFLDNTKTPHAWAGWRVPSMEANPRGQPTAWQPFPKVREGGIKEGSHA